MSSSRYLLALDQGTTSSRSILFKPDGSLVAISQREFRQIFPRPGWVEHDPLEIWQSQLDTAREVLAKANVRAGSVAAIGITNQRETTLLWNRRTGEPVCNALVWQDRRTAAACASLTQQGHARKLRETTGLVIDPYFSATKLAWMLDNVNGARVAAERGELAFGTVDSWLLWQLTGGAVHATDVSNASRTLLFDIHRSCWDDGLMALFTVPPSLMPEILPSSHSFGSTLPDLLGGAIPIGGIAGDQQAALFGQACFRRGLAKNTYGTGCFLLMHSGGQCMDSRNGLIATRAAQTSVQPEYALEGSVFIGGAVVQWLRDGLQAIRSSTDIEALAGSVPDSGGVVFVPAFTGLGAPYWQPEARGAVLGLTRGSTVGHIARAALESIAFQSAALFAAMARDLGDRDCIEELRVDGGASANNLLMQFQADLLGIPVVRPQVTETTALGAAYLAGLSCGMYSGLEDLAGHWQAERRFEPLMPRDRAAELMLAWERAVTQAVPKSP